MRLNTFVAGFIAACVVLVIGVIAWHKPISVATNLPPAPSAPPTTWPDYSAIGTGFATPQVADGELIAFGFRLVAETYAHIGPEVADSTKRFAGNNLACQSCHIDAGTKRSALPLVGVVRTYPK